jgi:two-component system, NtrC family, sensor kinase
VGTESGALLAGLGLGVADVEPLAEHIVETELPTRVWDAPASQPLLRDLVRLALDNRQRADDAVVEGLHHELDRMQEALEKQCAEELNRLHAQKLSALAEFAAGAGHEINNPLAVISGQAQCILKQLQLLDGPADEIDDVGAYMEHLKGTIVPSLHKIIGQTQRIHGILTGVMQFARPSAPRTQQVELGPLLGEVAGSLQELARERQVRLVLPENTSALIVEADPVQLRVAFSCLLRNAIEAAPREGWAGIRIEKDTAGVLGIVVEDNGQGPPPSVREHLFDPFFSGRSAGRGRGLGLSTAWRLARQHGGDVRFDGMSQDVTRFVLSLPSPHLNGHHAASA